jgi:hypothetical protein
MVAMTQKQRFLKTLLGSGANRFPSFDLEPAEETIEQWHREGLPARSIGFEDNFVQFAT